MDTETYRNQAREAKRKALEDSLVFQIRVSDLPEPAREVAFHPERKWRLDLCWPDLWLACEVDGGTLTRGRHVRPEGYERDCEKRNEAEILGYSVLNVTGAMVRDGRALATVERAIRARVGLEHVLRARLEELRPETVAALKEFFAKAIEQEGGAGE